MASEQPQRKSGRIKRTVVGVDPAGLKDARDAMSLARDMLRAFFSLRMRPAQPEETSTPENQRTTESPNIDPSAERRMLEANEEKSPEKSAKS